MLKKTTKTHTDKIQLRYGENPHQTAELWREKNQPSSLAEAPLLQGKPMSYNNYVDANAALQGVRCWPASQPACVIIKHATPCGVAIADTLETAFTKALATDPSSAFGGIVALNQPLNTATAELILKGFTEVIVAPSMSDGARSLLKIKKNTRLLICNTAPRTSPQPQYTSIDGGILVQDDDIHTIPRDKIVTATELTPSAKQIDDLWFAWQVVRQVKSNAIVIAKDGQALGIGTGQTSRIFSLKIAILKAQEAGFSLQGAAIASDAFFPFNDCVELAATEGIKAIIQPGGSIRDQDSIDKANELGMTMLLTGRRHFKH